jgi:L-threonylcarbamoyladenylate synthase
VTPEGQSELDEALGHLREGGIVCVPTESSYGLAVDATNAGAIARVQRLKGRGESSPFGLIVGTLAMAKACTGTWPAAADALAAQHWPGPLTLVLPPHADTLRSLLGPTGGVGVRVSSAEAVAWLATELGRPITATSANLSGMAPATLIEDARAQLAEGVDFYLDGGLCEGEASTLVAFDDREQPQVLRQGPIVLPTHS